MHNFWHLMLSFANVSPVNAILIMPLTVLLQHFLLRQGYPNSEKKKRQSRQVGTE